MAEIPLKRHKSSIQPTKPVLSRATPKDSLSGICLSFFHVVTLFSAPEPKAQVHYCDYASGVVNFSHFRLLVWNRWTEFKQNLTGSKISTSSTKFMVFGPIGKTRWPPWPLICWDIFDFSSEWNSTKLDRKQDLNVLYQVCVFRADQKNKMAALASDWLRHFRFLLWNCRTEFNKT